VKFHRVAKLFPDMPTKQFNELVDDIKENGQLEPILTCSGKIADGRHRYKACLKLKVKPRFVRWEDIRPDKDASLVTYVISRNLKRRHLDNDQRAAIATKALPLFEEEAKHKMRKAGAEGGAKSKRGAAKPKAPEENKGPADLRDPYLSEDSETTEVSDPAPAKKTKTDPKKKAAQRKQESASKAAEQAGVSTRSVQRAKAVGKKSKDLLKLIEDGTIKIALAEKLAELDAADLKAVLAEGKKTGDYRQALKDYLSKSTPAPKKKAITQHDIVVKLKRAIKQAEGLCATLEVADKMTQKVPVEKGEGLKTLLDLTERADTLAKKIAGDPS
jgi:ParB-like chromosome segregation protein Spo0J